MKSKLFTIVTVLFLTGCTSKSNKEVIGEYTKTFSGMRGTFKTLAAEIESKSSVEENKCPVQLIVDKNDPGFNTDFIMYDYLSDPDFDLSDSITTTVDLCLSRCLLNAVKWTGPKNPYLLL